MRKSKWETIACNGGNSGRLKVPNGWLVYFTVTRGVAMVFVADANHEWELEKI
jgi:hypothetical protein